MERDIIFIDVKVGSGALMKDIESARKLATTMIEIGKKFNKVVICILTDMDEPLGCAIGNALEVKEAIECLKGYGPSDIMELIIKIASIILHQTNNIELEEAQRECLKKIHNGEAYKKFEELVNYQHGRLDDMKISDRVFSVRSVKTGYINKIDALMLGEIAREIGAGRLSKEDKIDFSVGLVLTHKVGDFVNQNDELLKVYLNEKDVRLDKILNCFTIEEEKKDKLPLIYDILK